jgi:hypothetical protein
MRKLSLSCSDDEIKALVVEWSELLAHERYQEALDMFLHSDEEWSWTDDLLRKTVEGYGVPDPEPRAHAWHLEDWGVDRFAITSLMGRADKDQIIAESIQVDRSIFFGLDPTKYLGMVHYHDVPLNGSRSDLTARFHIKRVGEDELTLEFLDLHML